MIDLSSLFLQIQMFLWGIVIALFCILIILYLRKFRKIEKEKSTYILSMAIFFLCFSIYIALKIFIWLTKDLDELKEVKENNIAVGILLGIIIVSIALLLQPGIVTVLDSLIPFPTISLIDIG